jgi:hypothetical protein
LRWLGTIGAFVVGCAALIAGARGAGQSVALPPTYLEAGACAQPCWQGIKPGISRIEEFMERARTAGPYSGRTTDYGDGIAAMFELSTYGALTLGDVLRELGSPERVGCLGLDHSTLVPAQSLVMSVNLYFAEGLIVVNAVRSDLLPQLSPGMQVRTIRYYAPGEPVYGIGETTGWHGFATSRRYRVCHP